MTGWLAGAAVVLWLALWFGPPRSRRWHLGGYVRHAPQPTNATWSEPATKPLTPAGYAHPWYWLSYRRRAAIRDGAELVAWLALYGLVMATVLTLAVLTLAAVVAFAWGCWRGWRAAVTWQHRRHYERPVERFLTARLGARPQKVQVTRDDKVITGVHIEWGPEFELGRQDKELILEAVTTRLPIESDDVRLQLEGRTRSATVTQSEPPPPFAEWAAIEDAVARAGPSDLIFGPGRAGQIVKASLSSDSPHLAVSGGSGGGKSNLAAVLMLQELFRGAIVFNLDPKWTSHLWLSGLPNVVNAHEIPQMHAALTWLGRELLRRTKVAYYSGRDTGHVRANVGPRLIVCCEELNYGMDDLKDHWSEIRTKQDPKKSPALKALSGLACAGRASDIHLLLMAQMLTAKSTGVSDSSVRGNAGIKCMVRYDANNWNMVVGLDIPMPAEPTTEGRIQVVTARGVQETQVPYLRLDKDDAEGEEVVRWARKFAQSGKVAELPLGEGGLPQELWPPAATVLGQEEFSVSAGQSPETPGNVAGLPPHPVTIREGCGPSMMDCNVAAGRKRVKRARLQPVGWDGPAALYDPADLRALREEMEKVPS